MVLALTSPIWAAPTRPRRMASPVSNCAGVYPDGPRQRPEITLVGVTGGTGLSAVGGLLAAGVQPHRLAALTRSPSSPASQQLATLGVRLIPGDLDDAASVRRAMRGATRVYVHALAADSGDEGERQLARAQTLSDALAPSQPCDDVARHLVFNSAAGIGRAQSRKLPLQIRQKGDVESLFARNSTFSHTFLRPAMFMEEWWKGYTRGAVLEGTLRLSLPSDKKLQLTAVRDVGFAAARALCAPHAFAGRVLPLAGDELTPLQMAAAFAHAQRSDVRYSRMPAWPLALLKPQLWRIVRFLEDPGYGIDVAACRKEHPWMLTFAQFLEATRWADASRSYSSVRYADADAFANRA